MENKLLSVINESGLDKSKSQILLENFSDYFKIASEWEAKANTLVITNVTQIDEMSIAREGRLFLKDKRILVEKTRKQLKESSLRESQTIDAIAKILTNLITPIEESLLQKEKFVEIQEQIRLEKLRQERIEKIAQYREFYPYNLDFATMSEEDFLLTYNGAKLQYEDKLRYDKEKELERQKISAELDLHEKRIKELRDYWMFMDMDLQAMNFGVMSEKYYDTLIIDLKNRKADYEAEKEKLRLENEVIRKKQEAAELERKRLTEELQKKEKEFREAERLKQLEEEKAKKEAIKLAKAPVKKQLMVWVDSFDIAELPLHDQVGVDIVVKFEAFKKWAKTQIENL